MQNYKVSIVIVYNDQQKLEEAKKYIFKQSIGDIELIALDNRCGRFSSAAQALNFGASMAKSDVIIFMHQDVYLWDLDFVKKYYTYLSNKENVIAGVVGVREKDGATVGDFYEGRAAKLRPLELTNGEITEVFSVDEFLFGMQKKLWEKLKFDEKNCFDWHFYAVDICYANKVGGGY